MNKDRRQRLHEIKDRLISERSLIEELEKEEQEAHENTPESLRHSSKAIENLQNVDQLASLYDLLCEAEEKIDEITGA